jgi:hypothetical protein
MKTTVSHASHPRDFLIHFQSSASPHPTTCDGSSPPASPRRRPGGAPRCYLDNLRSADWRARTPPPRGLPRRWWEGSRASPWRAAAPPPGRVSDKLAVSFWPVRVRPALWAACLWSRRSGARGGDRLLATNGDWLCLCLADHLLRAVRKALCMLRHWRLQFRAMDEMRSQAGHFSPRARPPIWQRSQDAIVHLTVRARAKRSDVPQGSLPALTCASLCTRDTGQRIETTMIYIRMRSNTL